MATARTVIVQVSEASRRAHPLSDAARARLVRVAGADGPASVRCRWPLAIERDGAEAVAAGPGVFDVVLRHGDPVVLRRR